MTVLVEGSIGIETEAGSGQATGDAVIIVPPGRSTFSATTDATLYRVSRRRRRSSLRLRQRLVIRDAA